MQRKKLLTCAIVGVVLLAVGTLPAQAGNLGKFAWLVEPSCEVMVLQVTEESGVFALHGFQRADPPPACNGPAIFATIYGTAKVALDGTIMLGFTVVFSPANGLAGHVFAVLNPVTLSGPWNNSTNQTGNLKFLGQVP